MIKQAISLHQKGRLAEAATLYRKILAANPKHADALNLLGLIEIQRKNSAAAIPLIDRAIAIDANNAIFFANRGAALLDLRRLEDALSSYDRSLAIKPDYADALNNRGVALRGLKRFADALDSFDRALAIKPEYAEAFNNRGNALRDLNRFNDALASYDQALAIKPGYAEALNNRDAVLRETKRLPLAPAGDDRVFTIQPDRAEALVGRGNALQELRRFEEALASYDRALAIKPDDAEALNNRGVAFQQLRRFDDALASYDLALAIAPGYAEALNNRGVAFHELKRFDDALASYGRALAIKSGYTDALFNRGNALHELKRFDDAIASYDLALEIKPDHAEALSNRGNVLQDLRRFDDAIASYDRALAIKPDYVAALYNRGIALREQKRFDDAVASYDLALMIEPDHAEVLANRGLVLRDLKRFDDALVSYDRALTIKPDAEAFNNRGNTLQDLQRFDDALASYDRALEIKPDHAEVLNNRGVALNQLERFDDAVASFDRALAINPDYTEAHYNRGNALRDLKRFSDALASYDSALAIKPDTAFLFGDRLSCKMHLCDWREIDADLNRLAKKIESGESVSSPFIVLTTSLSSALQKASAESYTREKYPQSNLLPGFDGLYRHDRIRLGYFSADFHSHATANLMAGLFECHDRAKFELFAFSFGPPAKDAMRARLEKAFDHFIEAGALSDKDVALLARSFEIDIAIDLKGFTQDSRPSIFAMRPAPIQVNYLGYPGTMGAGYIDYLIADSILIPGEQQQHYTEKIAYLPHTYQANDSKRPFPDKRPTRAALGLPEDGFVFCCFNNNYKITREIFGIWMRLLNRIEGSVLWLLEDNEAAVKNLRAEAQARGIAPARLVFAKRARLPEHLARQQSADLFLDTLPCNAHTTASDALWTGLPVLTVLGETFAGRVAASLLNGVGLPELIAQNLEEYDALALELALDPQKLLSLKQKLAANRLTHPLFDTVLFTKHIESAYAAMLKQYQAGLAPRHIHIKP